MTKKELPDCYNVQENAENCKIASCGTMKGQSVMQICEEM